MTEVGSEPSRPPEQTRRSTALLVIGGTFALQALTMVTGIVTARILGVEGRGLLALIFALSLMASQLTFGGSLPTALAKNLAERRITARDGLRGIARRRGWLLVVPGLAAAGVFLLLHEDDERHLGLATAVLVMTFQTIVSRLVIAALQGEVGRLGRMMFVALLPQFLYSVVLVAAFADDWGWDVGEVLVSFFAVCLVGHVIGVLTLAKPTRLAADALDEDALWRATRETYISSVRPLDSIGLDRIMVGSLMGNALLGLYSAAIAFGNLCGIVGNAVSVVVLPQIARSRDDHAAQAALARRWLLLTLVVGLAVVAVLELTIDPLIRATFGQEFAGATTAARWLIVADLFFGLRKVLIAVLQGQGRGGTASWIELLLVPVMVGGMAVASAQGELVMVGIAMLGVAVLSCLALAMVMRTPPARHRR